MHQREQMPAHRTSETDPARSDESFGPYRIGPLLGRGGMGEVHQAYDTTRERPVALKRLLDQGTNGDAERERFRREARTAGRLDSPHVVPIHDFGVIDDRLFIDMRLVRGRDLAALLHREGPLDVARAVVITAQLADALDAAHRAGVVHRDVKPSNALIAVRGGRDFAYLTDFGIVHMADASPTGRLTGTGSTIGTPSYMAPEYLCGHDFDHRLDVYALGCVLFEMLTGRPPFVGTPVAVMHAHVHETVPSVRLARPDLPRRESAALDAIIRRALAKDPAERPPSAGDLALAVGGAGTAAPGVRAATAVGSSPPAPTPQPRRARTVDPASRTAQQDPVPTREHTWWPCRRWLVVTALLVAVVCAGVIAALVANHQRVVARDAVKAQVVAQTGLAPSVVNCPTDLPAQVGASIVCTATSGGPTQPIRVSVTSIADHTVDFDITM